MSSLDAEEGIVLLDDVPDLCAVPPDDEGDSLVEAFRRFLSARSASLSLPPLDEEDPLALFIVIKIEFQRTLSQRWRAENKREVW